MIIKSSSQYVLGGISWKIPGNLTKKFKKNIIKKINLNFLTVKRLSILFDILD